MPRVSVVTPFYNAEAFLEDCIRSVLTQTFTDFEYVLLDNCSTDDSLEIAARYASIDDRIRLISNEQHLTQVDNYNTALAAISPQSSYCKIVQADDWLFKRCLEDMVAIAIANPTIGIVSSYRLAGTVVREVGLHYDCTVVSGREICRKQLLEGSHFFGSPTTLLIRADIVRRRQPFYEVGRLHEDTESCYDILKDHDFGFVHQVLSYSRTDNDSIMRRLREFNPALLDRLIVVRRFGPLYLNMQEYKTCWCECESRYLRFLGESVLRGRNLAFWEHQRRGWRQIGYKPGRARLLGEAILVFFDLLLNPKRTLTLGFCALRRRYLRKVHL